MLSAYTLPITIISGGREYAIRNRGDYRVMLDVIAALNDFELEEDERAEAALTIFLEADIYELPDIAQAAQQMCDFLSAGQHEEDTKRHHPKLMDWQDDAPMIVSGVNRVLGMEVRAVPYLHWWTFVAAYMEIGESTLATVISIRDKTARGKKLEKFEREFKRDHPEYFTFSSDKARMQRDMDEIAAIWGRGDDS